MDIRLFDASYREDDFPAGLKKLRMEEAGHFMHIEQPEMVNQALLDWLDSCQK